MAKASPPAIFARFGLRPVINACGVYTDLGGSRLAPAVLAGMAEMNGQFVSMPELLDATGARIAQLLQAPAARVTPGAAAAIMLATAAAMAGGDGAKGERLPDSSGMRNEVLIQAGHRYKYDRQVLMAGARLVEVGSPNGTRPDQLAAAITPNTAMVIHPAHLDGKPGTIGLEEVAALAHHQGMPVFVDAAYMVYPTAQMASYLGRGADLVAISSKYFGGPNAGGFVIGSTEQVAAITAFDFTRYKSGRYRKFGRPLKMDRQMVAAVVLALEEWLRCRPSGTPCRRGVAGGGAGRPAGGHSWAPCGREMLHHGRAVHRRSAGQLPARDGRSEQSRHERGGGRDCPCRGGAQKSWPCRRVRSSALSPTCSSTARSRRSGVGFGRCSKPEIRHHRRVSEPRMPRTRALLMLRTTMVPTWRPTLPATFLTKRSDAVSRSRPADRSRRAWSASSLAVCFWVAAAAWASSRALALTLSFS